MIAQTSLLDLKKPSIPIYSSLIPSDFTVSCNSKAYYD